MKICTFSRTPKADDVCTVMIRVFSRVVNGISTEPRMEPRVLEVAADRIVAPILREQREFHSQVLVRMDATDHRVANMETIVSNVQTNLMFEDFFLTSFRYRSTFGMTGDLCTDKG